MNSSSRISRLLKRFMSFALVGVSGIFVDMSLLYLLTDPKMFGLNLSLGKTIAAEAAIVNNFIWNDRWTFRDLVVGVNMRNMRIRRFLRFNIVCLFGICLSIFLLNVQVKLFHLNVYIANLVAIIVVSAWNFFMNLKYGWADKITNDG
jgi:dolichol-phosphate mannosyltransferase